MSKEAEERIKRTITIAKTLWKEAKIAAIEEGLNLMQVVEAALRKHLELLKAKKAEEKAEGEKP